MNAAEIGNRETMLSILDQPSIDIEAVLKISGFRSVKKLTAYSLAYDNGKNECLQLLESFGAQKVYQGLTSLERLDVKARNELFYLAVTVVLSLAAILGLYKALKSTNANVYVNNYLIFLFTYFSSYVTLTLLFIVIFFIFDYFDIFDFRALTAQVFGGSQPHSIKQRTGEK